jgi:hypothetical protein
VPHAGDDSDRCESAGTESETARTAADALALPTSADHPAQMIATATAARAIEAPDFLRIRCTSAYYGLPTRSGRPKNPPRDRVNASGRIGQTHRRGGVSEEGR